MESDPVAGMATPKHYYTSKVWLSGQATPPRHLRSKSAPNNDFDLQNLDISPSNFQCLKTYNTPRSMLDRRTALEQDVEELQNRLQNEQAVRYALEKAIDRGSCASVSPIHRHLTPETKELIHEINFLEEEVLDLEQQMLSLYRSFFNRWFNRASNVLQSKPKNGPIVELINDENKIIKQLPSSFDRETKPQINKPKQNQNMHYTEKSYGSNAINLTSVVESESHDSVVTMLDETLNLSKPSHVSHSQKVLQSKELKGRLSRSNPNSLNEDGPRSLREYLSDTPNKLSEELIRCMATIYCKLCDPPMSHCVDVESPSSCTSSSSSVSSVHGVFSDGWSPGCRAEHSYDVKLISAFQAKPKTSATGPYGSMVEVPWIRVDKDKLSSVSRMLRDFRSMVEQLEKVDPRQLKHDEKLAFWINVYNALLMHAYLAYGIPRNNLKRMSLLQRASYKVGGRTVNAHTIEQFILRCRSHRPTQWLQNLFSPSKLKPTDDKRSYAIGHPEPLVCFALCCGGQSDPPVRVYTAKNVHEELEYAKKEFLQATIVFPTNKKVLLPKIVEWYMREASIPSTSILEWVSQYLDVKERHTLLRCVQSKPGKNAAHCIEWMPYNFNFRYLFQRDLTTRFSSSWR